MTPKVLRQLRRTALSLNFAIKHKQPPTKRQRLEIQLQTLLTDALAETKVNHLAGSIFERYVPDDGEFLYSDLDRDLRNWTIGGYPPGRLMGKALEDELGM
jgi:hypothetical protein